MTIYTFLEIIFQPCYIKNRVITNSVIKRFVCIWQMFCIDTCFRLLKAFAEEQALEDAIYYLGEALRKNVVDLDVFLKVTLIKILNCRVLKKDCKLIDVL